MAVGRMRACSANDQNLHGCDCEGILVMDMAAKAISTVVTEPHATKEACVKIGRYKKECVSKVLAVAYAT